MWGEGGGDEGGGAVAESVGQSVGGQRHRPGDRDGDGGMRALHEASLC